MGSVLNLQVSLIYLKKNIIVITIIIKMIMIIVWYRKKLRILYLYLYFFYIFGPVFILDLGEFLIRFVCNF